MKTVAFAICVLFLSTANGQEKVCSCTVMKVNFYGNDQVDSFLFQKITYNEKWQPVRKVEYHMRGYEVSETDYAYKNGKLIKEELHEFERDLRYATQYDHDVHGNLVEQREYKYGELCTVLVNDYHQQKLISTLTYCGKPNEMKLASKDYMYYDDKGRMTKRIMTEILKNDLTIKTESCNYDTNNVKSCITYDDKNTIAWKYDVQYDQDRILRSAAYWGKDLADSDILTFTYDAAGNRLSSTHEDLVERYNCEFYKVNRKTLVLFISHDRPSYEEVWEDGKLKRKLYYYYND